MFCSALSLRTEMSPASYKIRLTLADVESSFNLTQRSFPRAVDIMACLARPVLAPAQTRRIAASNTTSTPFARGTTARCALPLNYVDFAPVTPPSYDRTEVAAPIQRSLDYKMPAATYYETYDAPAPLVRVKDTKNITEAVGERKKVQQAYEANATQSEDRTAPAKGTGTGGGIFDFLGNIFKK